VLEGVFRVVTPEEVFSGARLYVESAFPNRRRYCWCSGCRWGVSLLLFVFFLLVLIVLVALVFIFTLLFVLFLFFFLLLLTRFGFCLRFRWGIWN
jgi:hypothetical protein